ncbi:MAG: PHP domain-containing protein [Candidatus Omnitrophica bacterium]|nr:PHP domain-containing protein [Candidatus Omnitrophota bacterium]MBU1996549.1 PHP domain-containing protein [Candidatus Omnitrophota bacterium]
MIKYADLHIHTNYSDSTLTPKEVVEQAYKNNISCISITDHDTFEGIPIAIEESKKYDIEVISGIELSSVMNGRDVHILGYLFDHANEEFVNRLICMQDTRIGRMQKMINKLKELGIDNIELEDVCELAESKSVGRPHLALLLKQKGWVSETREAFDKYIAEGAPAYFPKYKQTPSEAIKLINEMGGVSVLAHPMITRIDELIPGLVKDGLNGIEVYYPNVSNTIIEFYEGMAKKHGLVATGGSDSHGNAKKDIFIGKIKVLYSQVEQLKDKMATKI